MPQTTNDPQLKVLEEDMASIPSMEASMPRFEELWPEEDRKHKGEREKT